MENIREFRTTTTSTGTTGEVSSSTTTRVRVRAREETLDMLADAYADTFDRRPPRLVLEDMEHFLDGEMEPVIIMWALDAAAAAPSPSWAYARAVLNACAREGVRTAEDWQARQDRWRNRRRPQRREALNYPQREYSAEIRRNLFENFEDS